MQRSGGRVYISLLMGKRGFLRREASPKEVLEHCLRLAREVAPLSLIHISEPTRPY